MFGELECPTAIKNVVPTCPCCGKEHSTDYIPKDCESGDEFYIDCEDCKDTWMVDVTFEEDFIEQNPHATLDDCLNSNNVMFDNYRLDGIEPTIESPF